MTAIHPRFSPGRGGSVTAMFDAAVAWVWLFGVALSPVWFGANTPIVWGAHAGLFGLLLAVYGAGGVVVAQRLPVPLGRLKLPLVALAVVLGWAVLQALPWVPAAWQNPVWAQASTVLGHSVQGAISVNPAAGWTAIGWTATVAAVFFLAVQLGRDPARARLCLYGVTIAGGAIAAYGIAVYLDGNQRVLWQPKHAYLNALTATFINKNNYAAYAGMILTCSFGLILDHLPRQRTARDAAARSSFGLVLLVVVFAVDCAALVLAGSRGATAATVLGIAVVAALWLGRVPAARRLMLAIFGLSAVTILVFAWIFGNLLIARLPQLDQDLATRLAVDARILAAIQASPWLGHGFGAFQDAFAAFRDVSVPARGRWEYAHNDWLEALMTLGVPAGLTLWLIFWWILVRCVKGALNRGRDAIYPTIGAGVCSLAAAHSLVDFTMQIQGFAIPFLAITGAGVAQSWSSRPS